ncbi:hypothetical protein F5B22DRAFT_326251 [Xylaria bambusicola]|uniref:uncharacterized protein n=1 Tax=Xylaria bambusicola TaxID=326684 RepID=UPI0020083AF9|nr:uncharacterized protein F5B22DRAFT_326251 [Xylaria bambusicola]KAI0509551.1 hypothetical protein F5B22DRAFT_326251 [Xylaria bambusicola]
MHPLGHLDPSLPATRSAPLQGIKMPGNSGEIGRSLDRHRTASYRLSCISEHQKENTRSSEDDYFSSPAQVIKTPSLEPVRWPNRRLQVNGKSQRSSDGSTVSPFHLDTEINGVWGQEASHRRPPQLVLSTWQCARSVKSGEQTEQQHEDSLVPRLPSLALPGVFEVQWQVVRWRDAQSRNLYIKEHRRTISGTGFDGPLSSTSGASSLPSPNDMSSPPLGPLLLTNCIPCKSRRSKSDTSGSADWERKLGKGHGVSESSDPDTPTHKNLASSPSTETANEGLDLRRRVEYDNISQFRDSQESALKSCPDFYRRSYSVARPSTSVLDTVRELKPPNYKQFDTSRHQHRHRIQNTVSKRFHSLRDRFRRGRSSSMFSVRPEFPPPPAGKVRRYRSRNSNEIWPSSEESPIFNTPASSKSTPIQQQNAVLLAAASGLRIATVELDRLTNYSRSAKSSLEAARVSSSSDSEESFVADTTPDVPSNSHLSLLSPPAVLASPMVRSPQWQGLKSRRQHSRLSEVTTPDEVNMASESGPLATYFTSKALRDALPDIESEGCMSEPLSTIQGSHHVTNSEPCPDSGSIMTRMQVDCANASATVGRTSAGGLDLGPDESTVKTKTREYEVDQRSSLPRSGFMGIRSEPGYSPKEIKKRGLASTARSSSEQSSFSTYKEQEQSKNALERSCHPDTWSPDRGEPGDSDPFCPEQCVFSDRCRHDSKTG